MSEFIQGNCPHCGNELQIPTDLQEFSCLYCGERCRTEVMLAMQNADTTQYDNEREYLRERLPQMVTGYPDYFKKITKKDFFKAFETYEIDNQKAMNRLDVCARLDPQGPEHCMKEVCKDLVDALEAHMMGDKRWAKSSQREQLMFETRVILAIFLTPLARKCKLETAELFRTELNEQWLARWPKQKWIPGDYEVLANGFRRKKLCFITTATCRHDGKPDDCAELTAFRAFRDGWLTEQNGQGDIELYYEIAPSIVTFLNCCDDTDACYAQIREVWLDPCYRALQDGRNEDCRAIYTDMVQTLSRKYLQ